ncbi:MAG: hypothetical protein WD004_02010 [Actinomycetota bacterium]
MKLPRRFLGMLVVGAVLVTALALLAGASASQGGAPRSLPAAPEVEVTPSAGFPPDVPQLPRNFRGRGRYVVPSLGVDVPFVWNADHGDMRMVAGGPDHLIWFTNLIHDGQLYTYTYQWPGITTPVPCLPNLGAFTLAQFNSLVATNAQPVGSEILVTPWRRPVEHWRMGFVAPPFPLASADIYVDPDDPTTWRQVLHFGLQNLYAADQDEWIRMRTWEHRPGNATLPPPCQP